jgi:hypothetical protein
MLADMHRRAVWPLLFLLIIATTAGASAHGEGEPWLFVAADRVYQGESFTVIGADMGPGVRVEFDLASGNSPVPLGEVTAAEDGHFETTLILPPTLPDGYVELRAVDAAGLEASTWLLVGDTVDPAVTVPPVAGSSSWWTDPSVLVLGVLILGGLGAVGYVLLKSRRAATTGTREPARPMARKQTRKRRQAH